MAEFAPKGPEINQNRRGGEGTLRGPGIRVPGTAAPASPAPERNPQTQPKDHKGRNIALTVGGGVVAVGTVIGAWLGIKGGDGSTSPNPDSTAPVGISGTLAPDFKTNTPQPGITATPEATQTPTEVPATVAPEKPAFQPGEKGLYESVDKMPVTDAQKEVLKKVLEGSDPQIITNRSIIALENGIEDRVDCPVSVNVPAGPRSACTSIDDVILNIDGFPKSAEILDSVGPAIQGQVSERDGGTPIFKVYKADTGVIENIPVTKNAADVVWVYEIIKEPQKAGSKEKTMVALTSNLGSTYIYYDAGVMVVRQFGHDMIGSASIGSSKGNQNYTTIGNIVTGAALQAYPDLLEQNLDGSAAFNITSGTFDKVLPVTNPIVELVSPGRTTRTTNDSIVHANGKIYYTQNNGQPVPRDNYLP